MGARRVVSREERRARLARRHRLIPAERTDDVAVIADDVVALHSSDPATVYLSVIVRMEHPEIAAIEHALYNDRNVVRHHAMRRTMGVMT
ncbi:MAG: DNA glycosylase AlkZ-like family protein, partial [Ilumatobacteraceae bacterium]